MYNKISENTEVTLDLKTIALVVSFTISIVGLYFTLKKDIGSVLCAAAAPARDLRQGARNLPGEPFEASRKEGRRRFGDPGARSAAASASGRLPSRVGRSRVGRGGERQARGSLRAGDGDPGRGSQGVVVLAVSPSSWPTSGAISTSADRPMPISTARPATVPKWSSVSRTNRIATSS